MYHNPTASSSQLPPINGRQHRRSQSANQSTPNGSTSSAANVYYVESPLHDDDHLSSHKSLANLSVESSPLPSPLASPYHTKATKPPPGPRSNHTKPRPPDAILEDFETEEPSGLLHDDGRPLGRARAYDRARDRGLGATIRSITLFILILGALFGFVVLVIWLILRPDRPIVTVKEVVFQNLNILSGSDASGVPTTMITFNATVKIDINNRSPYLKVNVEPFQIEIYLSLLSIATSQVDNYVQGKDRENVVPINIQAELVPLYGASSEVPTTTDTNQGYNIPLNLTTSICSRYLIIGEMLTSKFWTRVTCDLTTNTKTLSLASPIAKSCSNLL